MPLMVVAMYGFRLGMFMPRGLIRDENAFGIMGSRIMMPMARPRIMLSSIQDWRTMRGFGISVKSAALKLRFIDMVFMVIVRKRASMMPMVIIVDDSL